MTDATSSPRTPLLPALCIALGLIIGGFFIGNGVSRMHAGDRYVTVKGVSEQNVQADLAVWPINLIAADNDLIAAQSHLQSNIRGVMAFLAKQQIDTTQLALQNFSVSDAFTNQYGDRTRVASRYVIHQTVLVRSNHPEVILAASQKLGELAAAGVTLSSGEEGNNGGPIFLFTGLNGIKPKMIVDATARAREGAEEFAKDSHSALGGIRTASQGVFEILPRDGGENSNEQRQIDKTVRVVTTVEYFLKD